MNFRRLTFVSAVICFFALSVVSCQDTLETLTVEPEVEEIVSVDSCGELISYSFVGSQTVGEAIEESTRSAVSETGVSLESYLKLSGSDVPDFFAGIKSIVGMVPDLETLSSVIEYFDFETDLEIVTYRIVYSTLGGIDGKEKVNLTADVAYLTDKYGILDRILESVTLFSAGFHIMAIDCVYYEPFIIPLRSLFNSLVVYPHFQGVSEDKGKHDVVPSDFIMGARQAIDAERAALQLVKSLPKVAMYKGYYTENTGMSNGGGVAFSVHYLLENDPEYKTLNKDLIRLRSTCIAEGNLDYSETFSHLMKEGSSLGSSLSLNIDVLKPEMFLSSVVGTVDSHPEYFGINSTYGYYDVFSKYFNSEFLKGENKYAPYDGSSNYIETYRKCKLYQTMLSRRGISIKDVINPQILDSDGQIDVNNEYVKLLLETIDKYNKKDEVLSGWTPSASIVLAHSEIDDFVSIDTAREVADNLGSNVSVKTTDKYSHEIASFYFMFTEICFKKHPGSKYLFGLI